MSFGVDKINHCFAVTDILNLKLQKLPVSKVCVVFQISALGGKLFVSRQIRNWCDTVLEIQFLRWDVFDSCFIIPVRLSLLSRTKTSAASKHGGNLIQRKRLTAKKLFLLCAKSSRGTWCWLFSPTEVRQNGYQCQHDIWHSDNRHRDLRYYRWFLVFSNFNRDGVPHVFLPSDSLSNWT